MQQKNTKSIGRPRRDEDCDAPENIPMNQTEKLFVHQYLLDSSSVAEVMRKIGSDAKDLSKAGHKLLSRPNVRKAISEGQKAYIVNAAVTKAEIIIMLRKNWDTAIEKGDVKAANDAAKILGQACPDMFHAPIKVEQLAPSNPATAGGARTIEQVETLEAFSAGEDTLDLEEDLDKFLGITKNSDGHGEFS